MNVSQQTIDHALWLVACDAALMTMLHEWYVRDLDIPGTARLKFNGWIRKRLDCMAGSLGLLNVSAEDISDALRIHATGDVLAVAESIDAKEQGFKSNANCCVKEGVVFSGVWIRGIFVRSTIDRAEDMKKRFMSVGYSAEVFVHENNSPEATVNAQIDFGLYKKNLMDGTLAKATSIYRPIWYN